MLSVAVPDDGERLAAIADAVETEVIPRAGRNQRIDDYLAVLLRTKTGQTRDDQVGKGGMVVIARTLAVAHQPVAGRLIEIFADIRFTTHMLRLGVEVHLLEEDG